MISLLFCFILFQLPNQVYLVKNNLHTGIIFYVTAELINNIPALTIYNDYEFIDIGWGDEDFYQHPDPDYLLGAKALLVPTSSVIRVEGKNYSLNNIVEWSDFSIRFELNDEQFIKLCEFINNSFILDIIIDLILGSIIKYIIVFLYVF